MASYGQRFLCKILGLLHLQAVDHGRVAVEPKQRPHYTLTELLAASDYSQPQPAEEREWVDAPSVGGELI
jgi:antitoxin ChpS